MFGKKISYRDFEIDISGKEIYLMSGELYKKRNLRVLVTPLSGKLVIFKNNRKVRDPKKIKKIIDDNHDQIKEKKTELDQSLAEYMGNDTSLNNML